MSAKPLIPLSAGLFVFFVFSLLGHYLSTIFTLLIMPWWIGIIILLASLESAYFSTYLLTPRTPFLVSLVELLLWLLPIYLFVRRFNAQLIWLFLLVGGAWFMAREYGTQTVSMAKTADYLGDQAASTITWEYESLEQRELAPLAVEYFWWRLWFFGAILTVLAIISHGRGHILNSNLAFYWLGALSSGLLLQGLVYLFRLQILWKHAQVRIDKNLVRGWLRSLVALVLLITLVINIAPVNYSPLTAEKVGNALHSFFTRFAQNKSLLPEPPAGGIEQPPPGEMGIPEIGGELGLTGIIIGFLIFTFLGAIGLIVIFVVGGALLALFWGEVEKLQGLPGLAVTIYNAFRNSLAFLKNWFKKAEFPWHSGIKISQSKGANAPGGKSAKPVAEVPAGVRGIFLRIATMGGARGIKLLPSQTAQEYGSSLQRELAEDKLIEEFFSGYQSVRYSSVQLDPKDEKHLIKVGRQIIKKLKDYKKGE